MKGQPGTSAGKAVRAGALLGATAALAWLVVDGVRAAAGAKDLLAWEWGLAQALAVLSLPVIAAGAGMGGFLAQLTWMVSRKRGWSGRWTGAGMAILLLWGGAESWKEWQAGPSPLSPAPPPPTGLSPPPGAPHVILIVIDTLRADALEDRRFGIDLAPRIHDLAKGGISFSDATSASSWTRPATAALLTGQHPTVLDVHDHPLPAAAVTLAERFSAAGYETAGFSDNYLVSPRWGFGQGLHTFEVDNNFMALKEFWPYRKLPRKWQERVRGRFRLVYMGAEHVNQRVSSWLARRKDPDRPLFLYLHYMDPHYPYFVYRDEPENVSNRADKNHALPYGDLLARMWQRPYLARLSVPAAQVEAMHVRYLGGVQHVDKAVGEMLEELKRNLPEANTVLALTGDHGEEFLEHGLYGHGHSLYQELVHVPLILRIPGMDPGRTVTTPVGTPRLTATLLEAAGLDASTLPLPSLLPLVRGEESSTIPVQSEVKKRGISAQMVRLQGWKTLRIREKKKKVRYETYDLTTDPQEMHNLDSTQPQARTEVDAFARRLREAPKLKGTRMSKEELERLEALGYVEH